MRIPRLILAITIAFVLWTGPQKVQAQDTIPYTGVSVPTPPDAETNPGAAPLSAPQAAALNLPPLRAVIVVGPLDGTSTQPGPITTREINAAELAAVELESYGVSVSRFYHPNTSWAQIQAASNGAHFFMYRGHGIAWSPYPNPNVGGMGLTDRMYSNDEIRAGIKLAPGAVVMIYSCFSSGSSDTDTSPITLQEAMRRVDQYALPYLDNGASAVMTNWFADAFQMYYRNLFQGMTLGQAFQSYFDYTPTSAYLTTHPSRPGMDFWLEYENWNPYPIPAPQYDSSFVGYSNATLESLFAPSLELSTSSVNLLVRPNSSTLSYPILIDTNLPDPVTWTASENASWITASPTSGQSGSPLTLLITPGSSQGTFNATVTISTTHPAVVDKTEEVNVRLVVTNNLTRVFIPIVRR